MSILIKTNLVKCFQRFLPAFKCQNISFKNIIQPNTFHKVEQNVPTSIQCNSLFNHSHAAKSVLLGFSLLGLFGLDEDVDSELKLINTIKRGLLYLQKDDYNAFEQTLHDALKIAYDLQNFDGLTYVYDVLANGAFMKKDFANAEKLFVTVMQRLMSKGGRENDLNILHISLKLAKIYEAQNNFSKCEIGYEYCLKHLEEHYKNDPENENVLGLFALTLDAYARYLMNRGDTKKAFMNFEKSYDVCVKLNGEIFEMNVVLLNDLGTLSYVQGHVEEALKFFNKAAKIGQHLPDMENFSSVYINLGNIYLKQGLFKEAEKNCVEGMKNAKRHHYDEGKKEAAHCLEEIKSAMM